MLKYDKLLINTPDTVIEVDERTKIKDQFSSVILEKSFDQVQAIESYHQTCQEFMEHINYLTKQYAKLDFIELAKTLVQQHGISESLHALIQNHTKVVSNEELLDIPIFSQQYTIALEGIGEATINTLGSIGKALVKLIRLILDICLKIWDWLLTTLDKMFNSMSNYKSRADKLANGLSSKANLRVHRYRVDQDFNQYKADFEELVKQKPNMSHQFLAETYIFSGSDKHTYKLVCSSRDYPKYIDRINNILNTKDFLVSSTILLGKYADRIDALSSGGTTTTGIKTASDEFQKAITDEFKKIAPELNAIQLALNKQESEYEMCIQDMSDIGARLEAFYTNIKSKVQSDKSKHTKDLNDLKAIVSNTQHYTQQQAIVINKALSVVGKLFIQYHKFIVTSVIALYQQYTKVLNKISIIAMQYRISPNP
jgi:hypothetical protein